MYGNYTCASHNCCVPDDMSCYQNRLNTFNTYPIAIKMNYNICSLAGLYYTGKSDILKCFACHITIKNMTFYDEPFSLHKNLNNSCIYINTMFHFNCNLYSKE